MNSSIHTKRVNLEQGSALLIAVVIFVGIASVVTFGLSALVTSDLRTTYSFERYTEGTLAAESGAEDVVYRLVNGIFVQNTTILALNGATATTTITENGGEYEIRANAPHTNVTGTSYARLVVGSGAAFHYGIQSGEGGIEMRNSSSVSGNMYSNGSIVGSGTNAVGGSAISAGPAGLVEGVHTAENAHAHTIRDSVIDGDAYYQVLENTTVYGTEYPGSEDQSTSTLPISDELIEEWETDAEAGGTYTGACPYTINTDVSIGPIKIPCDLDISGSPTITLNGAVWVVGDVDIQNTATVRVSPSQSGKTIPVIADDPDNPTTKGVIRLRNSTVYEGASGNSYVLLLSQNTSAESGGTDPAIEVTNSAEGDLLVYAGHGKITLKNSVNLKEVTAYAIELQNSAEVIYESGLANLLFSSGPGGGYTIMEWGR